MKATSSPRRRLIVPEVVQSSAMDCGPAALKCLLEGFGIRVSYARLREACQTDLDGTSIDTLELVANRLGLEAEQIVLPADHLLLAEARALPALVVVRLANGLTHFVVAWRRTGGLVQVMDPAVGRRWVPGSRFLADLYLHTAAVGAAGYRAWAAGEEGAAALARRLERLGLPAAKARTLLAAAAAAPGWQSLAELDAAARMTASLVAAGGVSRGRDALAVLERFRADPALLPAPFFTARGAAPDAGGGERVLFRGAVLVRVRGRRAAPRAASSTSTDPLSRGPGTPPDPLAATLEAPEVSPGRTLVAEVLAGGRAFPALLLAALLAAAGATVVEALLFRGLLDLGRDLGLSGQRLGAVAAVLLFSAAVLLLELPLLDGLLLLGRRLETALRIRFLARLPHLGDRYFASRLTSDMAERGHTLHRLRTLPLIAGDALRAAFQLLFTAAGIVWLVPRSAPLTLLAALAALVLPLIAQPVLVERDLRVRSHAGAIGRFYLDALLGLVAVRTHGAERAVRREHESLLVTWAAAGLGLLRAAVAVEALVLLSSFALVAWLLFDHLARGGDAGSVLLLVYWALGLPALGDQLALATRQWPSYRNTTLRLLDLVQPPTGSESAPVTGPAAAGPAGHPSSAAPPAAPPLPGGVALDLARVSVRAGGHTILEEVTLRVGSGEHVAVVGRSGAGKSTLVGLLLGWHAPASGQITVDGEPLGEARLERLRRETAWVEPGVQLWNRSLLDNLRYGLAEDPPPPIGWAVDQADLRPLLEKLPDGLQTRLGEGGGLVSGGEGQRVRLARALLRPGVRLALLDEPFRGLDRDRRATLLARARERFAAATLLCVTHDVGETLAFPRVLVVDRGRIVEDGQPVELAGRAGSRYRALLAAESAVRTELWAAPFWRRLRLEQGRLVEDRP